MDYITTRDAQAGRDDDIPADLRGNPEGIAWYRRQIKANKEYRAMVARAAATKSAPAVKSAYGTKMLRWPGATDSASDEMREMERAAHKLHDHQRFVDALEANALAQAVDDLAASLRIYR